MAMTLTEAKQIAFDPAGAHATVTFDLAARVIGDAGAQGRDQATYKQLAECKAEIQRLSPIQSRVSRTLMKNAISES